MTTTNNTSTADTLVPDASGPVLHTLTFGFSESLQDFEVDDEGHVIVPLVRATELFFADQLASCSECHAVHIDWKCTDSAFDSDNECYWLLQMQMVLHAKCATGWIHQNGILRAISDMDLQALITEHVWKCEEQYLYRKQDESKLDVDMDLLRKITHVKIYSATNQMIPRGALPNGIPEVAKQKPMADAPNAEQQQSTTSSFSDNYQLEQELGRGAFSVVHVCRHKESQQSFAVKVITKAELQDFDQRCLQSEIDVLTTLLPHHDHIIRLHHVHDNDNDFIYLIMEQVNGGELLDRLIQKEQYSEVEARHALKHVFDAIHHCHSHCIAHRDLKPENLLLTSQADDATIKVADFGFAKHCPHPLALTTQCGSAQHVGPEILNNVAYGCKVDCWALGVIAFTLLAGCPPFFGETNQEVFRKILKVDYSFDDVSWKEVSEPAKDMIRRLLVENQQERWSVEDALHCEWMSPESESQPQSTAMEAAAPCLLLKSSQLKLKEYNAKRKLRAAVYVVMGLNTLGASAMA